MSAKKKEHLPVPMSSNQILASFVTSYGRIALYKHLKAIDSNLVYCDTDSAFYFETNDEISTKLDLGDSLGKLKNELSHNNHITLQICLAAKTYGYITYLPENGTVEVIKNKGFSTAITKDVNVDNFISLYRNKDDYISIENNVF